MRLGRCFANCKFDPLVNPKRDQKQYSRITMFLSHLANAFALIPTYTRQASTHTPLSRAAAQPKSRTYPVLSQCKVTAFGWKLRRDWFGFNIRKKLSKRLSTPNQTVTHLCHVLNPWP